MGLFNRKPDPIADRERALKAKIAALEGQIQDLHGKIEEDQAQPKLRSTALPHAPPAPSGSGAAGEPTFEEVSHQRVHHQAGPESTPEHYNELGIRKYDLGATVRRLLHHLRGSPGSNPKLVNYLAAGSIHGLKPLRYEERIARNRFLALLALFVVIILGVISFYRRNR